MRPRFGKSESARTDALEHVLLRRLVEMRPEDRVAEELREPLAVQEREVAEPQVARAPAEDQRVERDDDRAVPGRPRAVDEAARDLAVAEPVELEPAGRLAELGGDVLERASTRRSRGSSARRWRRPRGRPPRSASACAIERTPIGASRNGTGERSPSTSTDRSRSTCPPSILGRSRRRSNASRFARIVASRAGAAGDVAERPRLEHLGRAPPPSPRLRSATRRRRRRRSRSGPGPPALDHDARVSS